MIEISGTKVWFDRNHDEWSFTFKNIYFVSRGASFVFPIESELDAIVGDIHALTSEMQMRMSNPKDNSGRLRIGDGESMIIELQRFKDERVFDIEWSGGATWGDIGVCFSIQDHAIVAEQWAD